MEGCFISVYKAMDSHSFAGLAQEGHCQRLDNFIAAPLPFEGDLKWGGILELFSKCYLDPWGLGGMISLLPSPTTPGPSGPPPQPWGPLAIFSALSLDRGPQVQICLSLSRDEPTPTSPLGWFGC